MSINIGFSRVGEEDQIEAVRNKRRDKGTKYVRKAGSDYENQTDTPLTYLLAISSFIFSARSNSCFGWVGFPDFEADDEFRTVRDFALAGMILALMFEGERGRSGETAILTGCW